MKYLFILPLCYLFLLCLPVSKAMANEVTDTAIYQSLVKAEKGGMKDVNKAMRDALADRSVEKLNIVAVWARDAFFRPSRNPRYGLLYSDSLRMMADAAQQSGQDEARGALLETGTVTFFTSQLIAREDVARCEDKTAGARYLQNWSGDLQKLYVSYFETIGDDHKKKLLDAAIGFSNERDLEKADRAACASGMKAMNQAIENDECVKDAENNFSCNAEKYVTLISDDVWHQARKTIQDDMVKSLIAVR